jgi:hypothetical protein
MESLPHMNNMAVDWQADDLPCEHCLLNKAGLSVSCATLNEKLGNLEP